MKWKRQILTKEDWDKPIDTLIEAQELGKERIFFRAASDETLKAREALLEEERDRLKTSLKHAESDRLTELGKKQLGMMVELSRLKEAGLDLDRISKLEEEYQRESKEYFTLRELVWGHKDSPRLSKDSLRLDAIDTLQSSLWGERDRRKGIEDEDEENSAPRARSDHCGS